jgi:hypothetical protein
LAAGIARQVIHDERNNLVTAPPTLKATNASFARDLIGAARYYVGGWRGASILTATALAAALALSWGRLVAAGIAPVILTALPCLVMCGAGLCMNKLLGGSSCGSTAEQSRPKDEGE